MYRSEESANRAQFSATPIWPTHPIKIPADTLGLGHPTADPPLSQPRYSDMGCEALDVPRCAKNTQLRTVFDIGRGIIRDIFLTAHFILQRRELKMFISQDVGAHFCFSS